MWSLQRKLAQTNSLRNTEKLAHWAKKLAEEPGAEKKPHHDHAASCLCGGANARVLDLVSGICVRATRRLILRLLVIILVISSLSVSLHIYIIMCRFLSVLSCCLSFIHCLFLVVGVEIRNPLNRPPK